VRIRRPPRTTSARARQVAQSVQGTLRFSFLNNGDTEITKSDNARPPRSPDAPLFGMGQIVFSLFAGFISLIAIVLIFGFSLYHGYGEAAVRTLAFTTLVTTMLGLILVNRSRSQNLWRALRLRNRAVWWVVGGAFGFLAGVIYISQARQIFRFAQVQWTDLMIAIGAAGLVVLCVETAKVLRRKSTLLEPKSIGS
jgi:Ca2+-transporting ATPase